MTKDNFLFTLLGLLLGAIIGFFVTNSINQNGTGPRSGPITSQPAANSAADSMAAVQNAIEKARQAPNDVKAQMAAADLFSRIQRFDQAIDLLKKANEIEPDNVDVMVKLGNTSFDAGKYADAERWYAAALMKDPDELNVRTDMGLTYIFGDKPDVDRAIKEFKRVLDADPNHSQALQNLTVAYTRKSDAAGAEATLAKLEKADPNNSALAKLREEVGKLK